MTTETRGPSKGLAVAAAIVPWVFAIVGTGLLLALARSPAAFAHSIREGGLFTFAALGASLLVLVVLTVVLPLAARGRAIPSVVAIGAALLPWLIGIGGALSSLVHRAGAAAHADPSQRAALLAVGIAEALHTRLIGAWCSGGLAASVAVGLALGALAQRAPGRGGAGVGVGLVAALPLLAAGGIGIFAQEVPGGLIALLPPVALVLPVMLLAGGGVGKGPDARRSAALAATVPVAMALALLSTVAVTASVETMYVFEALANVEPSSRDHLIAQAALELDAGNTFAVGAAIAAVIAALPLALFGAIRARPSVGAIIGAVLVALVAVVGVAADRIGWRQTGTLVPGGVEAPWARIPGFQPVEAGSRGRSWAPHAVVSTLELVPRDGPRLVLGPSPEPLAAALRPLVDRSEPGPRGDYGPEGPDARYITPRLSLAIDARVSAEHLRALVAAAGQTGAKALDLVGGLPPPTPEGRAAIERNLPLFAPFLGSTGSTAVLLETVFTPSDLETDRVLLHATLGREPRIEVRPRAGNATTPFTVEARGGPTIDGSGYASGDAAARRVFVALGPDATAQSLAVIALELEHRGYTVVLAAGDVPGHPDTPVAEPMPTLGGDSGPEMVGPMSREVIQRVMRRNLPQVRRCYERALRSHPELAGRVVVVFVISPTGSVQQSDIRESTLGDADVEQCIRQAVSTWVFPAPLGGGIVRIAYPFVLNH